MYILSTRITYSDAQHLDLAMRGLEFTHYKGENSNKLYKHKRLIIQMESLYKIGAKKSASKKEGKYNYLILDEFSYLCRQFFSTTMDENRYLNTITFERLIRNTPNIIVMDAFLSQHHINIIKEFRPNKDLAITHYGQTQLYTNVSSWWKREEKEKRRRGEKTMSNHQAIINTIFFMAKEGKKIYVLSYSKEFIKDPCYVFQMNNMGDKKQDYNSDTDDDVKRWDMQC